MAWKAVLRRGGLHGYSSIWRRCASSTTDVSYMQAALQQASTALASDEVPVGAVVVDTQGRVVGRGQNATEAVHACQHAEVAAMTDACHTLGQRRLDDCELYVTLEPCAMCYSAAVLQRLRRVVYAAASPKFGAVSQGVAAAITASTYNHKVEVVQSAEGAQEAAELLRQFFEARRRAGKGGGSV